MAGFSSAIQYVELILTFFQYFSLINQINVEWPAEWTISTSWLNLFSIQLDVNLPGLPEFDFRTQFIIVTVIVPLGIAVLMLISFKTKAIVAWYFVLLLGLAFLFAGAALKLEDQSLQAVNAPPADACLLAGGVIVGLCVFLFLCYRYLFHKSTENLLEDPEAEEEHIFIDYMNTKKLLKDFLLISIFTLLGLLSIGSLDSMQAQVNQVTPLTRLGSALGPVFLTAASFLFIHFVLSLSKAGRRVIWKITKAIGNNFVRVLILLMTVLYIPVTNTVANAILCEDITCPTGTKFVDKNSVYDQDVTFKVTKNDVCQSCVWANNDCPAYLSAKVCPQTLDTRLTVDPAFSCKDITPYFSPIAILMGIGFILGVPAFYAALIRKHKNLLEIELETDQLDINDENWGEALETTNNVAKNIYSAFENAWAYWKVLLIIQKLAVVVVLRLIPETSTVIYFTLVIHLIVFAVSIYAAPYLKLTQDFLSIATNFMNMANSGLALALLLGFKMDSGFVVAALLANVGIPVFATVGGYFRSVQRTQGHMYKQASTTDLTALRKKDKLDDMGGEDDTEGGGGGGRSKSQAGGSDGQLDQVAMASLDKTINSHTRLISTRYFMVLGVVSFFGLAFVLIGTLNSQATSTVVYHTLDESMLKSKLAPEPISQSTVKDFEFLSYGTWEKFTNHCCCATGPSWEGEQVELWRCDNGWSKQRKRVGINTYTRATESGLKLRGFCKRTFEIGVCAPHYLKGRYTYEVTTTCDGGAFDGGKQTDIAKQQLW